MVLSLFMLHGGINGASESKCIVFLASIALWKAAFGTWSEILYYVAVLAFVPLSDRVYSDGRHHVEMET